MKQSEPIQLRSVMSPPEKALMMVLLIRDTKVFKLFREDFKPEEFSAEDRGYSLLWRATLELYDRHEKLPYWAALKREARATMERDPGLRLDVDWADMEALIDQVFDARLETDSSDDRVVDAIELIRHYREDCVAERLPQKLIRNGRVAADVPGIIQSAINELNGIQAAGAIDDCRLFPPGWDEETDLGVFETNIPFFDTLLDGGHAPGEVYGLLGPYGSAKTSLAIMLCCEAAKQAGRAKAGGADEYVFLVSYEAGLKELQLRALSYAAQIDRQSLQDMAGLSSLSTSDQLRDYEQQMFHRALSAGKKVLGEQERAERASKILRDHLVVLDFSGGNPGHRGAGRGYVEEIAAAVEKALLKRGENAKARLVVVDYVGVMARRYLAAKGKDESAMRHLVCAAPSEARSLIAGRFECPVWLLHQLSGEANAKRFGARLDHTDAAEAKNFGENLDFAFVIGGQNDAGLRQIACTKHRRCAKHPPLIIRVRGELGRVDGVGEKYVVDPRAGAIQERRYRR